MLLLISSSPGLRWSYDFRSARKRRWWKKSAIKHKNTTSIQMSEIMWNGNVPMSIKFKMYVQFQTKLADEGQDQRTESWRNGRRFAVDNFKIIFLYEKFVYDYNFIETCSQVSNYRWTRLASDNGLSKRRRQAILCASDTLVNCRTYALFWPR